MDADELRRLLDLGGADDAPPEADPLSIIAPGPADPAAGANPHCLEVDPWLERIGADLARDHPALPGRGVGANALADCFAAAFLPDPRIVPGCEDALCERFLADLMATPEYRALHRDTALDEAASRLAALHFAEALARLREDRGPDPDPGTPPPGPDAEAAAMAAEVARLRAAAGAVDAAAGEVAASRDAARALGLGAGGPGAVDPARVASLYRRVRGSVELRKILGLAGRFRRVAQSRHRQRVDHGLDDVVGVGLGGELSRLLPAELARLALPEAELDALRRVAERQAMVREHAGVEPAGRGPVIVVVDESGSMAGPKVHAAKALALAIAYVARRQGRWCALVAYSGGTGERLLALPPGRWDEDALLDWLARCLGGGSDLDVPIRELPRMYDELRAPRGRTDVVIVTDAICRVGEADKAAFLAWKARARARAIALVLENEPGDLAALCDEAHRLAALAADHPAVDRALAP